MFDFLTQQSYPRLWMVFHSLIGAPRDKHRIALSYLPGHKRILEIGCSLGVVAEAFCRYPSIRYLGIDIDEQAIRHARSRFAGFPHMKFEATSLAQLIGEAQHFDYVLFGNILHHVDDELARVLLKQAVSAVSEDGLIVVMEPDVLQPQDGWLIRFLYRLERGKYRRPLKALVRMAEEAGIRIVEAGPRDYSIGLLPGIVGGHMLVLSGTVWRPA